MPELPEVEALCRSLDDQLRGRVVADLTMRSVAALKTYDPPVSALHGRAVTGCRRRGKFIDIGIAPLHLVVHLARAGWLRFREEAREARPAQRGPLAALLTFTDGSSLEMTEQGTEKRLAVYIARRPEDIVGVARLGIDALDPSLTEERLGELLRGAHGTIKNALADQAVIAGVGNAYSDEILHAARVSPFRTASRLDGAELARVHAALGEVLRAAVDRALHAEVTSLRDAKRSAMRVHGRAGGTCPVCGDTVREVSMSTKSFQYCPACQTGGRVYADRRLSRLLR